MSGQLTVHRVAASPECLKTRAVVFEQPQKLALRWLDLPAPGPGQLVVDVDFSGISTGTERLLWDGTMPPFPGMGYPLVPGYETVGRVHAAGPQSRFRAGDVVFVSGASCYGEIHGLFGGAASRVVVDEDRVVALGAQSAPESTLLGLAATAYHALAAGPDGRALPDLIVGHGVLGRLLARLTLALGGEAPTVWEINAARRHGAVGYQVIDPVADSRADYRCIADVSGDSGILDRLVSRLARRGEIVLAGFYSRPLSFQFPPAFMREARFRIAAEWRPADLEAVAGLAANGQLALDGLITHSAAATDAPTAYQTAFSAPECLKMILDWRTDAQ